MSLREWMPLIRKRISTAGSLPQYLMKIVADIITLRLAGIKCGTKQQNCSNTIFSRRTTKVFPAKKITDEHRGVASVSATTTDDAVQAVTGKTYMSAHFGR